MQTTSNMFIFLTPSLCVYVCEREKEDIEKDATDDTNKICSWKTSDVSSPWHKKDPESYV